MFFETLCRRKCCRKHRVLALGATQCYERHRPTAPRLGLLRRSALSYRGCQNTLSRALPSDHFANSLEIIVRNRNATSQNSTKRALKNGGKAAILACVFVCFCRSEFQFVIICSEEFAKLSVITARDNMLLAARFFVE